MTDLFFQLLSTYGYAAVFLFAMLDHTGTPGAVMIAAGLAASGVMNIWVVLGVSILGGLAGDWLLYAIGRWAGGPVLGFAIRKKPGIERAKEKVAAWIDVYGGTVVIWARFVALIGRYASLVYGIFRYNMLKFTLYSLIGGIVMVVAFGLPTYYIGGALNEVVENSLFTFYLTVGVIIIQLLVSFLVYYRKHKKSYARDQTQG
jgi:membrane protein DedA with SNARE-associated domain